MLFGKKESLIGIDIGSRTLKAVELLNTKGGYKLKNAGFLNIPAGLIEDGIIRDPVEVSELIRQVLKISRIKERNVAIAVGGTSVIIKKITLQNIPEDKLHETITFEAEQYIPFDIKDVDLDYEVLGEDKENPNMIKVLIVAVKKDFVHDYVSVVQMAGLNPCVVDVDAFALQNIFEINYDSTEERIALIDIGARKTSLSIMKNNSAVFMRDVTLGCLQIDEEIASAAGCTQEEAEVIKNSGKSDKISEEQLKQIVSSVCVGWCMEIKRAFDFYYSSAPEDFVSKILISGGGANINEFGSLLAREVSVKVENINPLINVEIADGVNSSYVQQIAPQLAICLGLSLRRVDDK